MSKRKPIQIISQPTQFGMLILFLCDDGTLWEKESGAFGTVKLKQVKIEYEDDDMEEQ